MGMALRAVTDDRDLLALDDGRIGVFVVVNLHGDSWFGEFEPRINADINADKRKSNLASGKYLRSSNINIRVHLRMMHFI